MDRNSNAYTFIFAIIMVIVVAFLLAYASIALKPLQNKNVRQEKMQNILHTVGIDVERSQAEENFNKYITEQLTLKANGEQDTQVKAFDVSLAAELKKPVDKQYFPLYIADVKGEKYYIVPLRGKGLWDAIWGYVALNHDANTVKGIFFDHKGETAGLGGEITQDWFQHRFIGEKILDNEGNFVGISIVKGYTGGENKDDNEVDAISGATITGNGVTAMIKERLKHYMAYFKKLNKDNSILN